jgi:Asp-tRNA(Asn)/Glu-tRNA(Gln) amidotransferase A subunit family amidase
MPRTGVLKTADTLDTIGLLARSVDDLALGFEVMRVRGHNYPVSEVALADPARNRPPSGKWRIGVVVGPQSGLEAPAVRDSLSRLAVSLDADVVEVRLPPEFDAAHEIHEHIYRRTLAYYFKSEWASAEDKFSEVLRGMILSGLAVSPETYLADLGRQTALAHRLDALLAEFDVLIGPSTADEAPLGIDGEDIPDHCLIWTMCGVPAISLPLLRGTSDLPVGLQVVARRFADYKLLDFARLIEGHGV